MPKLFSLVFVFLFTVSEASIAQDTFNMQGAYLMTRQVVNDGTKDSLLKKDQFKIYTDRYMIYASPHTTDSLADYGIGLYKVQNGKVTEYVSYTASAGAHLDTFELKLTKRRNGYTQVINFSDSAQKFVLTEDYTNVSRSAKSPLDGAWKQTRRMYIPRNGNTVTDSVIQFKVYQSGYFIWANTFQDSATNKPLSSYGYGTFEMNGANRSKEVNISSTYRSILVGKPTILKLDFTGKDAYKQTITYPNGSSSVEFYERMK